MASRDTSASNPTPFGHSRRRFLQFSSGLVGVAVTSQRAAADPRAKLPGDPFQLGVASGDPDHRGFVLWTRLAPEPLQPDGGMPRTNVEVTWEVAEDDSFRNVVAAGKTLATPQLGHSVHVELDSLKPDRWYWYRFRCGDATSPTGRTRTMPRPHATADRVRFAVTSCQNYEQGLFTAYEQMARDEVDLVFHLGDYIYEYEAGRNGKVRTHHGPEIESLGDYRIRHAQYRADPLLHRMHAQCPWLVTWDDHEFDNNYATTVSEEQGIDPLAFLQRRANAYQAYYENMPLRLRSIPRASDMRLFRKTRFGSLAELLVLDTRQYRSDQPNGDRHSPLNDAALDPRQTMLGHQQYGWMCKQLIQSTATWNVLAQQVMMGMVDRAGDPENPRYSMDQWPGYAAERMRLVEFLRDRAIANPVILTGDIHSNWANELRVDDRRTEDAPVASEFVTTSLSSGGNGAEKPKGLDALLSANACVQFHNAERGYILCDVTPERWRSDYQVVDDVLRPGGNTFTRASFVVEAGAPRIQNA